jgi:hypothetical protein
VNVTIVLPPVAVDDSFNVANLRGTYNFSVLDNDSDPNRRQLRVANVIVPPDSGDIVVLLYGTSPANNATIIEVKLGGRPVRAGGSSSSSSSSSSSINAPVRHQQHQQRQQQQQVRQQQPPPRSWPTAANLH